MIRILLLITMISCVCGTLVVNVTQTHYQAEENDNVTLEWTFTSTKLVFIICKLITDLRVSIVYHLHEGVEIPESQDEQFSGRVQWDRDVLREGRLRLHVSRLRTEDSGRYKCVVRTGSDLSADQCWLHVTASVAQEPHTTPTVNLERLRQERLYFGLCVGIIYVGIMTVIVVGTIAPRGTTISKVLYPVIQVFNILLTIHRILVVCLLFFPVAVIVQGIKVVVNKLALEIRHMCCRRTFTSVSQVEIP